jgi:hypothetical protein
MEPVIRPQPVGFKNTLRTHYTMLDFFRRQISQTDKIQEEIDREARSYANGNMLRLRRIYQTPTLTLVAPLQREETHRVVRKYKTYKDFFFRLNMVTEQLDKLHFGNLRMSGILDFMIGILRDGLNFGGEYDS